jgi:hypothetical protein
VGLDYSGPSYFPSRLLTSHEQSFNPTRINSMPKKIDTSKAIKHYKGSDGVYITIPDYDKLGNLHQGAAINNDRFERSQTYYVSPAIGDELERILEVYDEQTLALLMGRVNRRALDQLGPREFKFTTE